jgi:hypothetical protein
MMVSFIALLWVFRTYGPEPVPAREEEIRGFRGLT